MKMVRISVIGPLIVEVDGLQTVTFRTKSVARIIGLLTIRHDRQWLRSEIANLIWPEADEYNARQNLRQNLVFVRRILGDTLFVEGEVIGLKEGTWTSDYNEFKNRTRTSAGPQTLADALALIRGQLLAGLDDPWILEARSSFDKQVSAVRTRVEQSVLNRIIRIRPSLTDIKGRQKEIRDAARLLMEPESRAFSITGQIGIGKSSIALAAVSRWHAEVISGESATCDVSEVRSEQELATRILCAFELGYVSEGSIEGALNTRFSELPAVVILDGISTALCESGAVQSILTSSPSLKIICTTRRVQQSLPFPTLRIQALPVPPQDADTQEILTSPAVELLTDELTKLGWDLSKASSTDIRTLQRIAILVDGNPAALQLAARLYLEMSLQEIEARLPEESLHTTIESMISSEFDRLTESERQIIQSASVLGEFWSLKTISDMLELRSISVPINQLRSELGGLTRTSLLEIKDANGIRYWKLPPMFRWHMQAKIGAAGLQDLHETRLKLADSILSNFPNCIYSDPGVDWRLEMEQYTGLLLDTARHLIKTSPSDSVRIAAFLQTYLVNSSMLWEARDILIELLKGSLETHDRARALEAKARFDVTLSSFADALGGFEQAEALFYSMDARNEGLHCKAMQAHVLCQLGTLDIANKLANELLEEAELPETRFEAYIAIVYYFSVMDGTREEMAFSVEQAIKAANEFSGETEVALVKSLISILPQYSYAEKLEATKEAVAFFEHAQLPVGLASAIGSYGRLYQKTHTEEARSAFQRAIALSKSVRHQRELCINLNYLGDIELVLGNLQEAEEAYVEIIRIKRMSNTLAGQRTPLRSLGVLRNMQGRYIEALSCFQDSDDLSRHFKLDGIDKYICSPHRAVALLGLGKKEEALEVAKESYDYLSKCPAEFIDTIAFDGPELVPMLREILAKCAC